MAVLTEKREIVYMKKANKFLIAAAALFLLFAVFTVLVGTVDVRDWNYVTDGGEEAGANGSVTVGFWTLNTAVCKAVGTDGTWYKITEVLGIAAIFEAMCFAALGLYQLIKRKNVFRVDGVILALGVVLILLIAFYVLFDVVAVNYRPVLSDGKAEASYPSSHTMLAVTVFCSCAVAFNKIFKKKSLGAAVCAVSAVLVAVTVVGRLLSGMHWLTDIIGGLILGASLIALFCGLSGIIGEKQKKAEDN